MTPVTHPVTLQRALVRSRVLLQIDKLELELHKARGHEEVTDGERRDLDAVSDVLAALRGRVARQIFREG